MDRGTVFDLTGPGMALQTFRSDSHVVSAAPTAWSPLLFLMINFRADLIDQATARRLLAQEGEWTEDAKPGTATTSTQVTTSFETISVDSPAAAKKPPLPQDQNGNVSQVGSSYRNLII